MTVRIALVSCASRAYRSRTKHGNCLVNAIMIASSRPGNEIRRVSQAVRFVTQPWTANLTCGNRSMSNIALRPSPIPELYMLPLVISSSCKPFEAPSTIRDAALRGGNLAVFWVTAAPTGRSKNQACQACKCKRKGRACSIRSPTGGRLAASTVR
jgi:hypothetical protein